MRNKLYKKILSTDSIIRILVIVALIFFASTEYKVLNIIKALLIVCGMFLIGTILVKLYQEFIYLLNFKKWRLSIISTFLYTLSMFSISILFFIFLSDRMMKYCFLSIIIILSLFLIVDVIIKSFKRFL